ncbi:hypothetical protein OAH18_03390 [bacterium]|nr:hypothetical protein [bacterium]
MKQLILALGASALLANPAVAQKPATVPPVTLGGIEATAKFTTLAGTKRIRLYTPTAKDVITAMPLPQSAWVTGGSLSSSILSRRGAIIVSASTSATLNEGGIQGAAWETQVGSISAAGGKPGESAKVRVTVTNTNKVAHIISATGNANTDASDEEHGRKPSTGSSSVTGNGLSASASSNSENVPVTKHDTDNDSGTVKINVPAGGSVSFSMTISCYAQIIGSKKKANGSGSATLTIKDLGPVPPPKGGGGGGVVPVTPPVKPTGGNN